MKEFLDLEPETWTLYESVKEKFYSKCQKILDAVHLVDADWKVEYEK